MIATNKNHNIITILYYVKMEKIIESHKAQFYKENPKHHIWNRKQKLQLAQKIIDSVNIEHLIKTTVQIVGENHIYINYPIFKLYAHDENFNQIIVHFTQLIQHTLALYPTFELHINLKSFSIGHLKKYENVIDLFLNKFDGNRYIPFMSKMCVYNTPSIIDVVQRMFLSMMITHHVYSTSYENENVQHVFYAPDESVAKLEELFS